MFLDKSRLKKATDSLHYLPASTTSVIVHIPLFVFELELFSRRYCVLKIVNFGNTDQAGFVIRQLNLITYIVKHAYKF